MALAAMVAMALQSGLAALVVMAQAVTAVMAVRQLEVSVVL